MITGEGAAVIDSLKVVPGMLSSAHADGLSLTSRLNWVT